MQYLNMADEVLFGEGKDGIGGWVHEQLEGPRAVRDALELGKRLLPCATSFSRRSLWGRKHTWRRTEMATMMMTAKRTRHLQ